MNYSYRLHPKATEDIANAYAWYEEIQTGLGERFIQTVKNKIENILSSPALYGSKKKGFRETIIGKDFPFLVVYKILDSEKEILISSIFHAKRNPKNKYRKI